MKNRIEFREHAEAGEFADDQERKFRDHYTVNPEIMLVDYDAVKALGSDTTALGAYLLDQVTVHEEKIRSELKPLIR